MSAPEPCDHGATREGVHWTLSRINRAQPATCSCGARLSVGDTIAVLLARIDRLERRLAGESG